MKLRYKEIEVRMQQGASILRLRVPEWEVPIIMAIHPEVTEIRDCVEQRDAPSVSKEMDRLKLAYGAEREEGGITGLTYVEAVYGQHGIGLQSLKRAMQGAVLPATTAATPYDLSPELRQDLLQSLGDDLEITDLIGETVEDDDTIAA